MTYLVPELPASLMSPALCHMIKLVSFNWQSASKMASSKRNASGRHLRRLCGHCNQELSYSAYRSHKALYYVESEGRWLSQTDKDTDQCGGIHQAETVDAADIIEDMQIDQASKLLL